MRVGNKCRWRAQIAKQSARDDQRLIGANAIGICCNGFQALCGRHLRISKVAPVRRTALFIHQLDQPQFGFGPQRLEIFYFERLNEHRCAFCDMAVFGQRSQ